MTRFSNGFLRCAVKYVYIYMAVLRVYKYQYRMWRRVVFGVSSLILLNAQ